MEEGLVIINPGGSRALELAMPAIQRVVGIADATINFSASPVVID
jgi:hypothetical protein